MAAALARSNCDREQDKFRETPGGDTCVAVCNDDGTPISGGGGGTVGTPLFFKFSGVSIPGTTVTGITETVPAGKKWLIKRAVATHTQGSVSKVLVAAVSEGSMRTGPTEINAVFEWDGGFEVAAGVEIKMDLTGISDELASDFELYLQVNEQTA